MSVIDILYDHCELLRKRWDDKIEYARAARNLSVSQLYTPETRAFWAGECKRIVQSLWALKRKIHQARAELRASLIPCGNPVWDHDRELANEAEMAE